MGEAVQYWGLSPFWMCLCVTPPISVLCIKTKTKSREWRSLSRHHRASDTVVNFSRRLIILWTRTAAAIYTKSCLTVLINLLVLSNQFARGKQQTVTMKNTLQSNVLNYVKLMQISTYLCMKQQTVVYILIYHKYHNVLNSCFTY